MDKPEGAQILNRIIAKGGLYGSAAKFYVGDRRKTDQFIRECFEQCHNQPAINHWGMELINDIQKYSQKPKTKCQ